MTTASTLPQVVVESLASNAPALLESLGNRLRYAILPDNTHTLTDYLVTLIDEHQPDFCVWWAKHQVEARSP